MGVRNDTNYWREHEMAWLHVKWTVFCLCSLSKKKYIGGRGSIVEVTRVELPSACSAMCRQMQVPRPHLARTVGTHLHACSANAREESAHHSGARYSGKMFSYSPSLVAVLASCGGCNLTSNDFHACKTNVQTKEMLGQVLREGTFLRAQNASGS
jgi:hypothetical protein